MKPIWIAMFIARVPPSGGSLEIGNVEMQLPLTVY